MRSNGSIRLASSSRKRWLSALSKSRSWKSFSKVALKSFRIGQLPLRLRPAFVLLTLLTLILLSLLGLHPTLAHRISPPIAHSDKLLHFVAFFLASLFFYSVWEVEDSARRRAAGWRFIIDGMSVAVCTGVGGVGSEFVQALLPYKTFQAGDVAANVVGSALGILLARSLAKSHRRAVELERLYPTVDQRTIDDEIDLELDSDEEGDREDNAALLRADRRRDGARDMEEGSRTTFPNAAKKMRLEENVWDDGDGEIFGLGEDEA